MKHEIDNRTRTLKSTRGPLRPKTSWTLVHKRLKVGLKFLLTLSILFCPQFITHAVSSINVAPHGESKWSAIEFCSSHSKLQNFYLAMASRRAALNGNASLIATFSSLHRINQLGLSSCVYAVMLINRCCPFLKILLIFRLFNFCFCLCVAVVILQWVIGARLVHRV